MPTKKDLRPSQVQAVDFIKSKRKCALYFKMGGGKTISVLTALSDLFDEYAISRVLVISTLRVVNSTWPDEIPQWEHCNHLSISIATGTESDRIAAIKSKSDIVAINFENVMWLVQNFGGKSWDFDAVVIDESSAFKSHSAKRFRAMKKVLDKLDYVVELTGTPTPNGMMGLWAQIYLLDKGERLGRNITVFRNKYYRQAGFKGYGYEIRDGAEGSIREKISDITLAIDDVVVDYDVESLFIRCQFDTQLREKYKEFAKNSIMEVADDGLIAASSAGVLTNKLLQFTAGNMYDEDGKVHHIHDIKIKALQEIIDDNPSENVLVAYNYKFDLSTLKKAFPNAVQLDDKPETIRNWNDGKIKMLLVHPASASHGLNLQFGGCVTIWYTLTWNLEYYQQLNARLARSGQANDVRIFHIIIENTNDENVVAALNSKAKTQNELLDYLRDKYAQE